MKERLPVKRMRLVRINRKRTLPFKEAESHPDVSSLTKDPSSLLENKTISSSNAAALNSVSEKEESLSWNSIIPTVINNEKESLSQDLNQSDSLNMTTNPQMVDDSRFSRSIGFVQVRMQNTNVIDGGAIKLIYSVHLGQKPVPAETAAKDMALLSSQEVALELGTPVLIQSERKFLD